MIEYFLYRINSAYDGFLPCDIERRARGQCLLYKWRAQLSRLQPDDIVLTQFSGSGCTTGVFAIARIVSVRIGARDGNVEARLIRFSSDNSRPLFRATSSEAIIGASHFRRRGAEVAIPTNRGAIERWLRCGPKPIAAPPDAPESASGRPWSLRQVPSVQPSDRSHRLDRRQVVAAYWIKPRQATWVTAAPPWLGFISRKFREYKAGDLSCVEALALALARRVCGAAGRQRRLGVVLSVPLSGLKRRNGEVDRVYELARRVSSIIGVPYSRGLVLKGGVSRRLYKRRRLPTIRFRRCYRRNLRVRRTRSLLDCVRSRRTILLIDDVYTDGVTTETILEAITQEFGPRIRACVATLGIMAKTSNMDRNLTRAWRLGRGSSGEAGTVAPG